MKKFLIASCLLLTIPLAQASDCTRTSVGLVPLMDGEGLYPSGSNFPPPEHTARGQAIAATLRARPTLVVLCIGMSNTSSKCERWRRDELLQTDKAANIVIVNGASGHQSADDWADPADDAYTYANQKLATAGVTPADVGVIWTHLTEAAAGDIETWSATVLANSRQALQTLVAHYPNTLMFLPLSRNYGGYEAPSRNGIGLNPEPYAWRQGGLMKDLISEHLAGTLLADKWIAWGPYLWADGLTPRSDGLIWQCSDFASDGVHPSADGALKASGLISQYFRMDTVARAWFLAVP